MEGQWCEARKSRLCHFDLVAPRGDEETEACSMVQTMRNGAEEEGPTTHEEEGDAADDPRVPEEEAPRGSTGWMERARMLGGQSGTLSFSASELRVTCAHAMVLGNALCGAAGYSVMGSCSEAPALTSEQAEFVDSMARDQLRRIRGVGCVLRTRTPQRRA